MGLAYIRSMEPTVGQYQLVEIVAIGSGSAPPRPTPGPTPPNWSPIHPENPIANPSPPYVDIGFPMPQPPLPGGPGGGPGATPGPGVSAIVIPMPVATPPVPPPAGMPPDSTQMLVWFGPGTKPAIAWVGPYASTGPITPPAPAPAPEAAKK